MCLLAEVLKRELSEQQTIPNSKQVKALPIGGAFF